MTIGIFIGVDKTVEERDFTFAEIRDAVGGVAEPVELADRSTIWVNDSFLDFAPDQFNSIASDVAGLGGRGDLMLDGIRGAVVVQGGVDSKGNMLPPTDKARRWVRRVAREA